MYSYYAISVLHLPFPAVLKRSLTKIQIAQFILGGSLGALNLILQLPKVSNLKWNPIQTPEGIQRLGTGFVERSCLHTPGQKLTVLGGVGCQFHFFFFFLLGFSFECCFVRKEFTV